MRINHNIQALNAYRQLSQNQGVVSKHLERLSSGLRINRAADDAAGLAISEKMRSQIRGLAMAERNTMDGISLIQTAEGALGTTHDILQRMRELAVQASNGTMADQDRKAIQDEIDQLTQEIDRIAKTTQFNAKALLRGAAEGRPFMSTDSAAIQYDPALKQFKGAVNAKPTEPAGFNIDLESTIDPTAMDGKTLEINGVTYEFDDDNTLAASTNVRIDITGIAAPASPATGTTEVNRLNAIATAIKNAITSKDPDLQVTTIPAKDNGTSVDPAHLQIRTAKAVSPKEATNYGFIDTDALATDLKFTMLDGTTTFTADGTTGFDVKTDSSLPTSISLDFAQAPKVGDSIVIDDVTITFGTPAAAYSGATKTATIDPTDKTIADVLNELKSVIDDAKTPATGAAAVSDYEVVGNSLVLSTTKTDDGLNSSLDIQFTDGDFAVNAGKPLNIDMQIGANAGEEMKIDFSVMDAASLGLARAADHTTIINTPGVDAVAGIDVSSSADAARAAITVFDDAVKKVSEERSKMGAFQNRMEYTISNLGIAQENLTAAESRVRDADMAMEMTNFTKNNIINQAATAMLAQANQLPQGILQLLK